jgi:hypothetical protein
MVGFLTLFGITTRNSIMMISHFEYLVQREGETWGVQPAVRGACERVTPVLMTAIVTALGRLIGVWRRARPCRRRDALGRLGRCDVPSKRCSPRVHHVPFEPDVSRL